LSEWEWRADVDALAFVPVDGSVDHRTGQCFVHRRAFATLLGRDPQPAECARYFQEHQAAFHSAAQQKIARAAVKAGENFHLTSRDIAREIPAHMSAR
jgi:hypothetical protein